MIDRYHLRYFLSVIDTGNFSRAAASCNVSQPTLSVGIAKLEQQLGRPVFSRNNKRVELTEAGARLASFARTIESGFVQAEREVAGTKEVGRLRFGVLSTTPSQWMERLISRPGIKDTFGRLEITVGAEQDLIQRLSRGRIDLALTILRPADDRFRQRELLHEGYTLALSLTHPLASRRAIAAEELINEPMIVRRHCEILAETSRFFTARGVRPFFPVRTTSDDRALSFVRAGLGVTVMPESFTDPGIVRPMLEGFDQSRRLGVLFAAHVDAEALASGPFVAALNSCVCDRINH